MRHASPHPPLSRAQRRVLTTTCASHGLIHVYELSVPALLWLIQSEFHAGDLRMGGVASLYALLFGVGALPAGYLVDRWGSKLLLLACLWGGSLSLLGMAVSSSLAAFTVCAACMGLALSIYHPAGTALLTHSVTVSGRVFALHGMAGNLGVAGASLLAGTLGALAGWRWALVVLAVAGLALGVRVASLPTPAVGDIRARDGRGRWPAFAMLLAATVFMGMVYRGMTTFLPKFFAVTYASDAQVGTALGGGLTTAALIVGIAGMYAAGRLIDRGWHASLVFLAAALLQAPFLVVIGFSRGAFALPLFMAVAFFHFFTQPAGNHMVADFTPPRLRGLGYGVYFLMTFGLGAAGAAVGGWVSERIGLQYAFPVLAAILVPSMVAIAALRWILRRERDTVPPPRHVPEATL